MNMNRKEAEESAFDTTQYTHLIGKGEMPQPVLPHPKARLITLESIYHQPPDGSPQSFETRHYQFLESEEEPWKRSFKVGPEWIPLECGWLKVASLLLLVNDGAPRRQVQPELDVQGAEKEAVLEFAVLPPRSSEPRNQHSPPVEETAPILISSILPGDSVRLRPVGLDRYVVRCQTMTLRCTITLIPV